MAQPLMSGSPLMSPGQSATSALPNGGVPTGSAWGGDWWNSLKANDPGTFTEAQSYNAGGGMTAGNPNAATQFADLSSKGLVSNAGSGSWFDNAVNTVGSYAPYAAMAAAGGGLGAFGAGAAGAATGGAVVGAGTGEITGGTKGALIGAAAGGVGGYLSGGTGAAPGADTAAASDAGMLPPPSQAPTAGTGIYDYSYGATPTPSSSTLGPVGFDAAGNPISDNSVTAGTGAPNASSVPGALPSPGFTGGGSGSSTSFGGSGGSATTNAATLGDPIVGGPSSATGGDPNQLDYSLNSASNAPGNAAPGLNPNGNANPMVGPKPGFFSGLTSSAALKFGIPAAYGAMALINSKKSLPGSDQAKSTADQYNAMGTADINNARAGNLTPAQQTQLNTFTQQQTASAKQMLSNLGLDPGASSQMLGLSASVASQAAQLQTTFLTQNFNQGMQEMGIASQAEAQYVQLALQQRAELSQALNSAMTTSAFMMML